jgi:hypothetical protein
MALGSAASDGGVGIEPWNIPRRGGATGTASSSLGPEPYPAPTPQGGGAIIGGGLGAQWPGHMRPLWTSGKRGLFGGQGDRGFVR